MRDRQTEAHYYPTEFLSLTEIGDVLCVAPHPDDEVLGAGGLLALLAAARRRVEVLVLSRGEEGAGGEHPDDLGVARQDESRRAATALGVSEPRFLDWPDRGIRYGEPLIADIASAVRASEARFLLLPALSEPHPDHQATALAGLAAAQRSDCVQTVLFYEVGAPTHPNVLVDITSVAERKWQAVREFVSQQAIHPYETQARAMATLRAFGRGSACTAAEAYFRVEVSALRAQGPAAALPWWPSVRAGSQLANTPDRLPLVSVLIRSMDRKELAEAVASVAAQTYSNLELVVVNASGRPHAPVPLAPRRLTLRLVQPGLDSGGAAQACERARAANLALEAAHGDLALFLDDDDLLHPEHIERLVGALERDSSAVAAYAGVRVEGPELEFVRDYDLEWSSYRLQGLNFLPIHAVLFRMGRVKAAGLAFDESLPVLEDWEFWRKLAESGPFVHCPGVSAVYRQWHSKSRIGDAEHRNFWRHWHLVLLEKSIARLTPAEAAKLVAWHAVELDRLQVVGDALVADKERLERELHAILGSRSWRITRPLRRFAAWWRLGRG